MYPVRSEDDSTLRILHLDDELALVNLYPVTAALTDLATVHEALVEETTVIPGNLIKESAVIHDESAFDGVAFTVEEIKEVDNLLAAKPGKDFNFAEHEFAQWAAAGPWNAGPAPAFRPVGRQLPGQQEPAMHHGSVLTQPPQLDPPRQQWLRARRQTAAGRELCSIQVTVCGSQSPEIACERRRIGAGLWRFRLGDFCE